MKFVDWCKTIRPQKSRDQVISALDNMIAIGKLEAKDKKPRCIKCGGVISEYGFHHAKCGSLETCIETRWTFPIRHYMNSDIGDPAFVTILEGLLQELLADALQTATS